LYREELDIGSPMEAPETPSVICPRCESEVPSSIYCVACGCPIENEAPAEENSKSSELRFDLTPLMEMQAEGEPEAEETISGPPRGNGEPENNPPRSYRTRSPC
jgi:hypothetical protein